MIILGALMLLSGLSAQAAEETFEEWTVKDTSDGFSDAKRGIAHTKFGGDSVFVVKCDTPGPGAVYAQFIAPAYLGSDGAGRRQLHTAKYRIDDQGILDLPQPYYNGKSAALLDKTTGTAFLNSLVAAKPARLRAQFTTFDGDLVNVDVKISGIADAVRRTAAICQDTTITG